MLGHFCNASIVFNYANVPVIRGHMPNMDRGQYTEHWILSRAAKEDTTNARSGKMYIVSGTTVSHS